MLITNVREIYSKLRGENEVSLVYLMRWFSSSICAQSWQKLPVESARMLMMDFSLPFFHLDFLTSKYCLIFMKLGTHALWMNTQTAFFHFF